MLGLGLEVARKPLHPQQGQLERQARKEPPPSIWRPKAAEPSQEKSKLGLADEYAKDYAEQVPRPTPSLGTTRSPHEHDHMTMIT